MAEEGDGGQNEKGSESSQPVDYNARHRARLTVGSDATKLKYFNEVAAGAAWQDSVEELARPCEKEDIFCGDRDPLLADKKMPSNGEEEDWQDGQRRGRGKKPPVDAAEICQHSRPVELPDD